jgi:hypothetical protein
MNDNVQLPVIPLTATNATVPALIAARGPHAGRRFVEFFTANIRNPNTRKACYRSACEFFDRCDLAGLRHRLPLPESFSNVPWVNLEQEHTFSKEKGLSSVVAKIHDSASANSRILDRIALPILS